MKNTFNFAVSAASVLTIALLAAPAMSAQQYGNQGYPQQQPQQDQRNYPQQGPPQQGPPQQGGYPNQNGYGQGNNNGQWDAPPRDYSDVGRRAFHDGMDTARSDWEARRPMDFQRARMYRKPPVSKQVRDEYRNGFSRGYDAAMRHHGNDHRGPQSGYYPR